MDNNNKIVERIANAFGVRVGEEFYIKKMWYSDNCVDYSNKYMFNNDLGFVAVNDKVKPATYKRNDETKSTLDCLINGDCKIVKGPFVPRRGDEYYRYRYDIKSRHWEIAKVVCTTPDDEDHQYNCLGYKLGIIFRTKEEAEKHYDSWIKFVSEKGDRYTYWMEEEEEH